MRTVSVHCGGIRLAYGPVDVLNGVSIDVDPGEFFALLGPSGCGKSSLLKVIAGFAKNQSGQVLIGGKDVTDVPPWQRGVGMVFQNYALWPHLSVWDNVAFGLVEKRLEKPAIRARVASALEMVGLVPFVDRKPSELSGGEQQRVALARTIVIEPEVLLLDEPLSNLDKNLRVQLRSDLVSLQRRLGITTIFVTHDQEEAMTTADRMAILHGGVVQQVGAPATLYDYPVNSFVARFVGTANLLVGAVKQRHGSSLTLHVEGIGDMQFPVPPAMPVAAQMTATFRPQSLRMEVADAVMDARYFWMAGTVRANEFHGGFSRYQVVIGDHAITVDQPYHTGLSTFPVGAAVKIGLDPSQARLLTN